MVHQLLLLLLLQTNHLELEIGILQLSKWHSRFRSPMTRRYRWLLSGCGFLEVLPACYSLFSISFSGTAGSLCQSVLSQLRSQFCHLGIWWPRLWRKEFSLRGGSGSSAWIRDRSMLKNTSWSQSLLTAVLRILIRSILSAPLRFSINGLWLFGLP